MWQTFRLKIFNNKKLFYIACVCVIGVVLFFYALIFYSKSKDTVYDGELAVSSPQIYIDGFSELKPGANDPNNKNIVSSTSNTPRLDILTTNGTVQTDVNLQYIATIYAKAINAAPNDNITAGDYLDASMFYVSNIAGEEINDKYYVLDNKTTILAKNYTAADGDVIAVRYYLPSEPLPACQDESNPTHIVNSYRLGLDSYAPMHYVNNAEVCITIKTQATAHDVAMSEWQTSDSKVIFSTGYSGFPIDESFLSSPSTSIIDEENVTTGETSLSMTDVPVFIETEPDISFDDTAIGTTTFTSDTVTIDTTAPEETTVSETTAPPETEPPTETTTTVATTVSEQTTTEATTTTIDPRIFPESMSINTGKVTLKTGETYTFSVTFDPSNVTETGLTWSSDNTSVATVNSSGTVTAHGAGTAAISVKSVNGMQLTVYVTVTDPVTEPPATEPPVTEPSAELPSNEMAPIPEPVNIILNTTSLSMAAGDSYKLSADVYPLDIQSPSISWSSNDSSVVQVDSVGNVYAVASGSATITATTSNGISAECRVVVQ